MTCLARSYEQPAKLVSARSETFYCVIQDSLWNFLPPDTLALVASHLKPRYIAAARETCKAWRHGISRGVTTLAPNVQSPSGGRIGSVASYYLYAALRWQDMPMLLVSSLVLIDHHMHCGQPNPDKLEVLQQPLHVAPFHALHSTGSRSLSAAAHRAAHVSARARPDMTGPLLRTPSCTCAGCF